MKKLLRLKIEIARKSARAIRSALMKDDLWKEILKQLALLY